jgi:hypothetical protein
LGLVFGTRFGTGASFSVLSKNQNPVLGFLKGKKLGKRTRERSAKQKVKVHVIPRTGPKPVLSFRTATRTGPKPDLIFRTATRTGPKPVLSFRTETRTGSRISTQDWNFASFAV